MTPHAFVKRQRSQSAESASSSASNKRGSPSVALAAMDINQEQNTSTSTGSSASASGSSSSNTTEPLVSEDDNSKNNNYAEPARSEPPSDGRAQLNVVLPLISQKTFEAGDTWFVIDRKWYRRWQAACGDAGADGDSKEMSTISLGEVGPIDNSGIAQLSTGKLTKRVTEDQDVVFVPGDAWHILAAWYGTTGTPIKREVITARDGAILDLYPPEIVISKVIPASSPSRPTLPIKLQTSSGWTISHLKTQIAQALQCEITSVPSRIWHLNDDSHSDGTISADKLLSNAELELGEDDDIIRSTSIKDGDHLAFEQANEDGSWIAATPTSSSDSAVTAPPPPSQPIFGGQGFVDNMQAQHDANGKKRAPLNSITLTASTSKQGNNDKVGEMRQTRSQTGSGSSRGGLVGLQNLGNTCFMNSALQCLSNTPSLQQYFYTGLYKSELNPDNPLGMNGEVAKAFGTLIQRIWSGFSSVTPREFKQTLSKFAPAFSGWQQHDSQELLAFLLDGLHEDLNRIKKKPYDEIPDWEGGADKEEMELADRSWEIYKRRNDSVIVDLFQGQYRSRLTCPECGKIAIKFDPFMYLSLAIPQNKKWSDDVYVVPLDPKLPQIKVTVEVPANASFRKLKQTLGEMTGYDHKRLFAIEEYSSKFWKVWSDSDTVSQLQARDVIVFYELPYEVEQPKYRPPKAKTLDEEGKIFITVLHYRSSASTSSYSNRNERNFGEPFVLALTKEEACDVSAIERKLCERLSSWQGVGNKAWAANDALEDKEMDDQAAKTTGKARLVVPDDDEDEKENGDVSMREASISATDATSASASTSGTTPSTKQPNYKAFTFHLSNRPLSGFSVKPFTEDVPSERERYTVQDRFDEIKAKETKAKAPAQMPGSFSEEEPTDLYGDSEKTETESSTTAANVPGTSEQPTKCSVPILLAGETLAIEWDADFAAEAFGSDADKKRGDGTQVFSRQERMIAESIQERKKLGNKSGGKKETAVEDLLDEFVKEEKLSEDNTWYCPKCKKHQEAQKKFDLWKMPDVLVIHLKRFSNERAFRDKIDTMIDFPIDGLDLSERVEGKKVARRLAESGAPESSTEGVGGDEKLVYDLFAVDNHFGGLGGGHYTAFCKNVNDGKWYNFDDSRVSPVSDPNSVKTTAAYLLFYRRRTEKLGGKTHDILASQANSPDLTTDQSFRTGGSNGTTSPYFLDQESTGHHSRRGQGVSHGFPEQGDGENALGGGGGFNLDDDNDMMDGPSSAFGTGSLPSPVLSDDGVLPDYPSTVPFRGYSPVPFGTSSRSASNGGLGWDFGASQGPSSNDGPVHDVNLDPTPAVPEVRMDPSEMAKAANDVEMEEDAGEMDELE